MGVNQSTVSPEQKRKDIAVADVAINHMLSGPIILKPNTPPPQPKPEPEPKPDDSPRMAMLSMDAIDAIEKYPHQAKMILDYITTGNELSVYYESLFSKDVLDDFRMYLEEAKKVVAHELAKSHGHTIQEYQEAVMDLYMGKKVDVDKMVIPECGCGKH